MYIVFDTVSPIEASFTLQQRQTHSSHRPPHPIFLHIRFSSHFRLFAPVFMKVFDRVIRLLKGGGGLHLSGGVGEGLGHLASRDGCFGEEGLF